MEDSSSSAETAAAPPHHAVTWRRVVLFVLVGGALVFVLTSDTLHAPLVEMLAYTERAIAANPVTGALLFVLFAALSGMLAFFSSAVIVPVAVYAFGPALSAALLWVGWILGGSATYAIGRWLGRPVAGLVAPKGLERYEHKITRETPFSLVILFQMATPSEVPGYFLGLVRYSFLRYIAVVAAGELPYAVGTVILGESFIKREVLPFVLLGATALGFSAWAYARFNRRLRAVAKPSSATPG